MAPFMTYLLFMGAGSMVADKWPALLPVSIAVRGLAGLAAFWLVRKHLPSLGRAHLPVAVVVGILAAVLWVGGQHLLNLVAIGERSLGGSLAFSPSEFLRMPEVTDPREGLSTWSWSAQAVLRITVACTTVPIVEEIFWRGFLLRAFIDWDRFEEIPLGKFTLVSFLATAMLSTLQHPANWGVSIFCWFLYNGLMYWKKSLLCLMITHGVTNLVLYLYVIAAEDWLFW